MRIFDTIRRAGRSLSSAKARTILTSLAIGVGAFALTLTLSASNGAQDFVNQIISDNFDPAELVVTKDEAVFGTANTDKPREYDPSFGDFASNAGAPIQIKRLTEKDIKQIKKVEGVEGVREDVVVNLQYLTRAGQKKYVGTLAVFSPYQKPDLLAGSIPSPLNNKKVLLPEGFVYALGFSSPDDAIGKKITLVVNKPFDQNAAQSAFSGGQAISRQNLEQLSKPQSVKQKFSISAVLKKPTTVQPGTELYLYSGVEDVKDLNDIKTKDTDNYRKYTDIFVKVKDGKDNEKLVATQNMLKNMGYQAQSVEDTQAFLTQIISVLQGIVATFGAIAVIASVFGVVNTMYISVLQRTREIGLMKALGMRKRDVGRLFRLEAAWIGLIGGLIGAITAFILGTLLNPWITEKLQLGEDNRLLIFDVKQIMILIFSLMIVATLAGLLPARKAAKLDPIEALRTE